KPGEHGSTYGGSPIACKTAIAALEVLRDEKMAERSEILGQRLREGLQALQSPLLKIIRGKGLLNAIVFNHPNPEAAWDFCLQLKDNGLLAKPTHGDKVRFAPPLVITEEQMDECVQIIAKTLQNFQ